jgi:septum formation protein
VPTPFVLASASPARRSLLAAAGVSAATITSGVDEEAVVKHYGVDDAQDVALVLARAKAEDVASRLDDLAGDDPALPQEGALVLGCDSVLELDGQVHGRPTDLDQARERWHRMRGRSGILHTGHWLVDTRDEGTGATLGAVASTTVHFARITDEELEAYLASGEPLQVAGAFAIDGLGGPFVRALEGDHHNVVGLSLPTLRDLLSDIGLPWTALW